MNDYTLVRPRFERPMIPQPMMRYIAPWYLKVPAVPADREYGVDVERELAERDMA
jgi:hypothetical protein